MSRANGPAAGLPDNVDTLTAGILATASDREPCSSASRPSAQMAPRVLAWADRLDSCRTEEGTDER
jgi:hypothetical protein